jgi:hypothetical protein
VIDNVHHPGVRLLAHGTRLELDPAYEELDYGGFTGGKLRDKVMILALMMLCVLI